MLGVVGDSDADEAYYSDAGWEWLDMRIGCGVMDTCKLPSKKIKPTKILCLSGRLNSRRMPIGSPTMTKSTREFGTSMATRKA